MSMAASLDRLASTPWAAHRPAVATSAHSAAAGSCRAHNAGLNLVSQLRRRMLFGGKPLAHRLNITSRLREPRQRTSRFARASAVEEDVDIQGESIAEDYYSVLGLKPDATQEDIRRAYYTCMKVCHPDLSNNHPDSVAFCAFVNEVYEVLSDPEMRAVYDEIKGYSVSSMNPFYDTEAEREYAFVDEFSCIGCKNCANCAERTFGIEDLWGRARVYNQKGDMPEKVQEAIDTCPVECIHWVSAAQLALLEDEMRRMERVSVGIMMAGQGSKGVDVFRQANNRWEARRRAAEARARMRAAQEKKKQEAREKEGFGWGWDAGWGANGKSSEESESDEDTQEPVRRRPSKERMERAAAAARRWREYSQAGVDRRRRGLAITENKWEEIEMPANLLGAEGALATGPGSNGTPGAVPDSADDAMALK